MVDPPKTLMVNIAKTIDYLFLKTKEISLLFVNISIVIIIVTILALVLVNYGNR